jgi:hypothetical protein
VKNPAKGFTLWNWPWQAHPSFAAFVGSIVHNEMGVTLQGGLLVLLARLTWWIILHNGTHSVAQSKRKTKDWGQHYTQWVKAKVELKSSIPISAIIEISLKGFTLGAKAEKN